MMLTTATLAVLERLYEKATPGPWRTCVVTGRTRAGVVQFASIEAPAEPAYLNTVAAVGAKVADADFIVALVNAFPALVADAKQGARDTERMDGLEWFGCMTGDCPHDTQAECDVAILSEVRSVLAERTAARSSELPRG